MDAAALLEEDSFLNKKDITRLLDMHHVEAWNFARNGDILDEMGRAIACSNCEDMYSTRKVMHWLGY